jgi:integrase
MSRKAKSWTRKGKSVAITPPYINGGGGVKKGRIYQHARGYYYISWYDEKQKKNVNIYYYFGQKMYDRKLAEDCLACMRSDVMRGIFRIDRWKGKSQTDVTAYLSEWLEVEKSHLAPSTYKSYETIIRVHLTPWFQNNHIQLHEIQYDTLNRILNDIKGSGKTKNNVMYCLRSCLGYAKKSERIPTLPIFPEQHRYNMIEHPIDWISEERQMKIISAIPEHHQPIFWWLKYHLRRPSEAMALHRADYIKELDAFIVRRGISNHKVIERTKTKKETIIPCHPDFRPIMKKMVVRIDSPFFFTHSSGWVEGHRYTHGLLWRVWNEAKKSVGETINMYSGLKHSSCSQLVNEKGLTIDELQMVTDHKQRKMVLKYAAVEVETRRELMQGRHHTSITREEERHAK